MVRQRRLANTALKLAGPALNGAYAVVDFNRDSSEVAKAFATKYEAAYKIVADVFAAWSYDAVHVLARAIAEAKSLEPEKLRQAILSMKGYGAPKASTISTRTATGSTTTISSRINNGVPVFLKHIDFND